MVVAFSPDGTRIVTASDEGGAKVWDARTGTALLELSGYRSGVMSVAFSPDGARIVTGSWWVSNGPTDQQPAKVWDARTGTHLLDLKGHRENVQGVAFSPDGTRIVTGSRDRTTRIWDARSGTLMLQLNEFTSGVTETSSRSGATSVAFSPDGTRIVTGSQDMTAKVWDARTSTPKVEHKLGRAIMALSPDGTRAATASGSKLMVWDSQTGTRVLDIGAVTASAAFSPDGTRIITGGTDQSAKVWDARPARHCSSSKGTRAACRSAPTVRGSSPPVTTGRREFGTRGPARHCSS